MYLNVLDMAGLADSDIDAGLAEPRVMPQIYYKFSEHYAHHPGSSTIIDRTLLGLGVRT